MLTVDLIQFIPSYCKYFFIDLKGGRVQDKTDLFSRGCHIIIKTRLNIKIGIVQKVYYLSSCVFDKMIPRLENYFGKVPAWSLIYFFKYAYFDIFSPVQK